MTITRDPITGEEVEAEDYWVLEQGTDKRRRYQYCDDDGTPLSLAGFTARAMFKRTLTSDAEIELTTGNGGIELEQEVDAEGETTGVVSLVFAPAHTSGVTWARLRGDVELIDAGGQVSRLVRSFPTLSKEYTT